MMQGQLSRADLFTALIEADDQVQAVLIKELDLFYVPEKVIESVFKQTSKWQTNKPEVEDKIETRSPTAILTSRYWQLVKQVDLRDEKKEKSKKKTDFKKYVKKQNFRTPPSYAALTTLEDMRSRLFSRLNQYCYKNVRIDIPAIINKLSRAELIFDLPKKPRQHSLDSLQIIDDRQIRLTPYWMDHVWITKHIFDEYSTYRVKRAVIQNDEYTPKLITDDAELFDYKLPAPQSPILILSDLGRLTSNASNQFCKFNSTQKKYWKLLQQLKANANPIVLLTPCNLEDYPHILRQNVHVISWESHTQALLLSSYHEVSEQDTNNLTVSWIELLLTLISPSIRLEPQLLRSIRTDLKRYGYSIPTAIEGLLWQHADIKEPHNIAATIDNQANKKRRRKFTDLEPKLQALALKVIRQWRGNLPPEIWFEELLSIEAMLELSDLFIGDDLDSFNEDIAEACGFLQNILNQNKLQDKENPAYRKWASRLEARISKAAVETGKGNRLLQSVFHQLSPHDIQSKSGHVIDPDLLVPSNHEKKEAFLFLYGNQLAVSGYEANRPRLPEDQNFNTSSLIGPIKYSNLQMKLIHENGVTHSVRLPSEITDEKTIPIDGTENIVLENSLIIKTDHTELSLMTIKKPVWASGVGRDAHGLFADMHIPDRVKNNIKIRFRWISAGQFQTGDIQYQKKNVVVKQGFWFAENRITKSVWEAVTNSPYPSNDGFTWKDAQWFLKKIKIVKLTVLKQTLESNALHLDIPTETQWEYAIRRGSSPTVNIPFVSDFGTSPYTADYIKFVKYPFRPAITEDGARSHVDRRELEWCRVDLHHYSDDETLSSKPNERCSSYVLRCARMTSPASRREIIFTMRNYRPTKNRISGMGEFTDFRLVINEGE